MKNRHVKHEFLNWFEESLSASQKDKIKAHLERCAECRIYYQKMSSILEIPQSTTFPELEPDPFLPTKIKAASKQIKSEKFSPGSWMWIRVSGFALLFCIFLFAGALMGYQIFQVSSTDPDREITRAYSEAFSMSGVEEKLAVYFAEEGGEEQ